MLVKILRGFPYAADGIRVVQIDAGGDVDIRDDLVPGLIAEGYVELPKVESTDPETAHQSPSEESKPLPSAAEVAPDVSQGAASTPVSQESAPVPEVPEGAHNAAPEPESSASSQAAASDIGALEGEDTTPRKSRNRRS